MALAGEPFQAAHGKVIVEKQGGGRNQVIQTLRNELFAAFHAGGAELQGAVTTVAVDDQTGQKVSFAVAEPVPGGREEALAQVQGLAQTLTQQRRVQGRFGLTRVQPRADQRGRVQAHAAQRRAARIAERGLLAGREIRERTFLRVHLIAEHPKVSGADAAVLIFFEPEFAHRLSRESYPLLFLVQKAWIYPDNEIFPTTGIAIQGIIVKCKKLFSLARFLLI